MPAFKRFGPGDQVDNVLVLQPKYDLVSGSAGWRGSPNSSSSLSLYGGARRSPQGIFSAIRYESLAPNVNQTGHPTRGEPLTASIDVVWLTDEELDLSQRSRSRWGREHWDTVQRLYQDYQALDPDYVTGSYDNYVLYFQRDSTNILAFNGPLVPTSEVYPSGSFLIESWIKPFQTSSADQNFTVASINRAFWVGITGSTGRLVFSSSVGAFTASSGPPIDRWSHVAVLYDSTSQIGSFRINALDAGSFSHAPLVRPNSLSASFTIGGQWTGSFGAGISERASAASGALKRSFHGLIGETRLWCIARSDAQLSASMGSRLLDPTGTLYCVSMREGPLASFTGQPVSDIESIVTAPNPGSGTLNQREAAQDLDVQGVQAALGGRLFGHLNYPLSRVGPIWVPNDNRNFVCDKVMVGSRELVTTTFAESQLFYYNDEGIPNASSHLFHRDELRRMVVIDVPSAFYGRQITPGSVVLTCRAYSSASHGLVRTLIDDSRGGLFISGSVCSGTVSSRESYRGVEWNKVGNVFYGEGLIVVRDPALLDFGRDDGAPARSTDTLQLTFRGDSRVPVKTLMCRIDRGEFNATLNPTFRTKDPDDGSWDRRHTSGNVRVTTVGLYNSDRELVGVARLADPVRLRPRDRINIRLRMDF